jgi:hypothetical protein
MWPPQGCSCTQLDELYLDSRQDRLWLHVHQFGSGKEEGRPKRRHERLVQRNLADNCLRAAQGFLVRYSQIILFLLNSSSF